MRKALKRRLGLTVSLVIFIFLVLIITMLLVGASFVILHQVGVLDFFDGAVVHKDRMIHAVAAGRQNHDGVVAPGPEVFPNAVDGDALVVTQEHITAFLHATPTFPIPQKCDRISRTTT